MKRLLLWAAAFCVAQAARAETAPMVQQPHPAVARIIAPESDGTAYGSGSLIAVNEYYGLVITNWHVVRDATAQIWVVFPGGFQSPATVMKVDRDWDLAALIVWKPNVQPLPVSTQAPQLGERLTIAGYGSGWYRAVSGQCIQYFSPGGTLPAEIVELSTPARNGDSGGPILNDRGEVAGVLFGSDDRSTMGSYCGRLRRFLAPLANDFARLPIPPNAVARQTPESSPIQPPLEQVAAETPVKESRLVAIPQNNIVVTPTQRSAAQYPPKDVNQISTEARLATRPPKNANSLQSERASVNSSNSLPGQNITPTVNVSIPPTVEATAPGTLFDQLKSFLAVVGIFALFIQCLKILGKTAP